MINDGKGSAFMKKFDFTRLLALVMAVLLSVSLVACDEETLKTDGKHEGDLEDLLEEIYAYGTYSEMLTGMLEAPADTENHFYARLLTIELNEENDARFLGTSGIPYERAIASEPNISPTLYSLCLLKVKEGEDVAKVAKMVKENADPRKWVCTGLSDNDVYVEYADDVVLLVMSAEDGEALAEAFRAVMKGIE